MKPRLHSLLPRPPHPTRDGLAIRNYHLLRALASEFRVVAFALREGGRSLGDYPAGIEVREIPRSFGGARKVAALLAAAAGGSSYPERRYRSARLLSEASAAARDDPPRWIVAHSYHLGLDAARIGPPAWVDFHNVDSEIWDRLARTSSSLLARRFARSQVPAVRRLEGAVLRAAAGISTVSGRDAGVLAAAGGPDSVVVPNGVDLVRYAFREGISPEKLLFFVGDLSWPPNAEGVLWFRRSVWPLLAAAEPDLRVEILGRGASGSLLAESDDGFRVLGEGGDTRPYWRRAAVAIVPLLAGGGTRLKILEAAASGVPVVSTSVGAEGLDLEPGEEIAIADDPGDFAEAARRLLRDPAASRRMARAARRKVEASYEWTRIGESFVRELVARMRAA
jgi:polysaccharide biosynthesis protein PslH